MNDTYIIVLVILALLAFAYYQMIEKFSEQTECSDKSINKTIYGYVTSVLNQTKLTL